MYPAAGRKKIGLPEKATPTAIGMAKIFE